MEEERIYGGNDVAVDLWCVHSITSWYHLLNE